jgi:hypothetical protein
MKQSPNKTNSGSGRVIAVILILLFFGINFFKSQNEAGPQEKQFAKAREMKAQDKKFDNNLAKHHDIKKLRFAYTGTWEPNLYQGHNLDGNFAFETPPNSRSNIEATAAKKVADAKKKAKLAKKTKHTTKVAKNYGKSRFTLDDNGGLDDSTAYPRRTYYNQNPPQERTPSDDEKEKKLTVQEWLEKIAATNSVSELVSKYKEGTEVNSALFYSVVESLLSSDQDGYKKLGFTALAATPSSTSLAKVAQHISDEMSADTKTFAQNSLNIYNQPNYLKVLNFSLKSSDSKLKILAATIIKNIVATISQAEAKSGGNVVYSPAQIQAYKTLLTESLDVINNAIKSGLDGEVLASFSATQSALVELLG